MVHHHVPRKHMTLWRAPPLRTPNTTVLPLVIPGLKPSQVLPSSPARCSSSKPGRVAWRVRSHERTAPAGQLSAFA